ncbi:MAG: Lrp/AsnC ligand binding domain-containing protein [Desulfobacterales bacterium]|nr:Lrp/AsnC ligand binding domain-containing protein [Desulfobacterales bacterium]
MAKKSGEIDDLEKGIIIALQEDARKSFKSIARDLGVSEGTISNRVGRLVGEGILKLEARINPFKLRNKVTALIGLNLHQRYHPEVLQKLQVLPNVNSVWVTTGKYDLFMEVVADSINDLNDFLFNSEFKQIEEITFTETHIMLHSETKLFKLH